MTNEQIIFNEVCSNYDSAQRHDLVSRFYTAEQVQGIAAGLELVPDDNGNTLDPIESAESLLCAGLFHTWAEWHRDGLTVKRGEKAAITCELWKFNDKKQPAPDADELTKAAAEQDKGYYYLAKAHLFHRGQVEKQQPKPAGRFKSLDEIRAYNKMLADQRKAAKAANAQQDKPQQQAEQPAPVPKQKAAPSAADLKKAERKAMREFMAVSEEDRPAQAKALAKWRETRQTVADAESTPKTAAPAPAPEPEAKPQTKAAPAASADSAPAYCEQISFC